MLSSSSPNRVALACRRSGRIASVPAVSRCAAAHVPANAATQKLPGRFKCVRSLFLPRCCVGLLAFSFLFQHVLPAQHAIPHIERRLPPPGIELPPRTRGELDVALQQLEGRMEKLAGNEMQPDVEIYAKAVRYALLHGEFYNEKQIPLASDAIKSANDRLAELAADKPSWLKQTGLVVRGYRSAIDGSAQPFGLEIPEDIDWNKPVPLYVWLHGRGDQATDLHFIAERQSKRGQIHPAGAIVLHPFGRQCVGFKSAGEIDVLEAIKQVQSQYKIDADRIVLMGFSMGGAGAWHLGAHYPQLWCGVAPGAGFAETAEYNRLKPADFPPAYVQKLWTMYDVPNYTRNLLNIPVVAYSGENDKQMQAALVMERALADHGAKLTHVIGPGMGHQYHPDSLKEIMQRMALAEKQGRPADPDQSWLQTRTLRYNQAPGIEVLGLKEHWQDSRVDVRRMNDKTWQITTKNVTELRLPLWEKKQGATLQIDGQKLTVAFSEASPRSRVLSNSNGQWTWRAARDDNTLRKRPLLQGPIDDAFMAPFLMVIPSGQSQHARVQRWLEFESSHFQDRWRALMRGELRIKRDVDITEQDAKDFHLVLWGDADANSYIKRILPKLPIGWDENGLQVNGKSYDSSTHVPLLVYPNPESPLRYVVLNSGLTFREANDRTNSLQNPQLPDWAVIDLSQLPNDQTPGKIIAADFFDEQWNFKAGKH